ISNIERQFNTYDGAQIIGGVSDLYHLLTTDTMKTIINKEYYEKLYTREFNPRIRKYQCISCKEIHTVGPKQKYETIEILKKKKCEKCQSNKFKIYK
ncbi:MAG: hypothetical protein ACK5LC_15115, partial [Coprobacillaceae bacterium]